VAAACQGTETFVRHEDVDMTLPDAQPADEDAFEEFYGGSKDRVLRAVIASTGDAHDAEDCTAEAFARAYTRWSEVRACRSPAAWVVRTAVNLHIDRYRRHQSTLRLLPALAGDDVAVEQPLPLDPALLDALKALPERQRQVVALRVLLGLSGDEAAHELGISAGSVGTHLHRALGALRPHVTRTDA
jgi:RNA polymerase sigma-70 factor (ECF subfamily)